MNNFLRMVMSGFDPEGDGYDYDTASQLGYSPDSSGHWSSIVEDTGLILKGRQHPTWNETVKAEEKLGRKIMRIGDRYYSITKEDWEKIQQAEQTE